MELTDCPITNRFIKKLAKLEKDKVAKESKLLKKKAVNHTEKEVKVAVVKYLKKKGWEVFTAYLGGIPTGGGMLAPNPLKGFPDLICTHSTLNRMIFIELKRTKGGKLSPEQIRWHERLKTCSQVVFVVTCVEDLIKENL